MGPGRRGRAALEARRARAASRRRVRGSHRPARRSSRHRALPARALDRRRSDPLRPRRVRHRSGARPRRDHGERADRSYMLDGGRPGDPKPPATIRLTQMNFAAYPMVNGLTRLASRFLAEPGRTDKLRARIGEDLDAAAAAEAGLVTFTPDDIDWDDEVRIAIEERAAFSPDALTGMEASIRFGGPETLESKIFGRLSAWQNWIFQRGHAGGPKGALEVYGTGP